MTAAQPAVADLILGHSVGPYRITAFLAEGGMGTVYRAEHGLLGKAVAVKVLRPALSPDLDMLQRFFNEARAASSIRHPGIVEVYDFGHLPDGRAYIVMEFLEGENLAQRLERCARLPELAAAVIARGIAVALAAAHANGIVHRDLKPDNVFLVPDAELPSGERCKVLDFGIAKLIGPSDDTDLTATGTVIGTPLYMSPEQARGAGDLDHRADLYSLGCLLYEMVTGEPPFLAEAAAEILAQHLYGELASPRSRVPELSAELDALIVELLAKEPADRPGTATEVSDRLSSALVALSDRVATLAPVVPRASVMIAVPHRLVAPVAGARHVAAREDVSATVADASGPPGRRVASRGAIAAGALVVAAGALISFAVTRGEPTSLGAAFDPGPAAPLHVAKPVERPEPPETVTLRLAIQPATAAAVLDGARPVVRDGVITLTRDDDDHLVEVSAPGFLTRTLRIHADRDQTIAVGLAPLPTVTRPAPARAAPTAPSQARGARPRGGPRPVLRSSPIEERL